MASRSCDETCCQETGSEAGHEAPTRRRRRLLLIVVTGTMVVAATLIFAAFLAFQYGPYGPRATWLAVALAVILAAIIVVSPLAILYLAVCVVGLLKGRRPGFQLHLSTCVALMFVGSLLMWANLANGCDGWPFSLSIAVWGEHMISWEDITDPAHLLLWSANVSAAVAILGVTAVTLESLTVRRREREMKP